MLRIHSVEQINDPRLLPYRTMREQEDHQQQKIFVAEGDKVLRRLFETKMEIISVLLPAKWVESLAPALESRPEKIDVFVASKEIIEKLVGFHVHQGVMALAKIPASQSLPSVLEKSANPRLFVAVDGLSGVENLGVLIRNAVAFGAQAIILGPTSNHPYLRRSVRSSMGTIFKLPFIEAENLAATLKLLRAQKVRCIAAHPHTDRKWLWQTDLTSDCCIVLGSEGVGISPEVLEACDEAVAIPMSSEVDSLNVASAAAAFFYEAKRQRVGIKS
ncbi:MAG: hypothetical protein JWM68_3404 [Verrucomicrobiales bacterium]|nr:hypothetical protein [Verrucomicrobiales bacterium]